MFIDLLRSIRGNLREVADSDHQLHMKLVGPQPENPSNSTEKLAPAETVASMVDDIRFLSERLVKAANSRHELIGDFNPSPVQTAGMAVRARA
jgi:hypothetical protein